MTGRKDALVAAAGVISGLRQIALSNPPNGVATVGSLTVEPNSRNTIPGAVDFSVDMRNPDDATLEAMDKSFRELCASVEQAESVKIAINQIWHCPPVIFDDGCVQAVRQAAQSLHYSHQDIVSGAGHDACQVARIVPTGMIFVPCADGLSHNEEESAEPEDLESGCNVLFHTMLSLANAA